MKTYALLIAAAVCLAAQCGMGQGLELTLKLDVGTFVVGEAIQTSLTLANRSTGDFSTRPPLGDDRLFVEVLDSQREPVSPLKADGSVGDVTLIAGDTWTGSVKIDSFFPLRTPGRYFATLVAIQDDRRYTSPRKAFDVVPGLEIKSALQLFPKAGIRGRRFSLVYLAREQREILFLRMEDDQAGKGWETVRLGGLLRISEPRIDISPDGTVTVLHRATQDAYLKTAIRSQPEQIEVLSQEQLLDPAASMRQHMEPFQKMAIERHQENKKSSRWWPFGKSENKKNGD